ncbi:MAG TPA: hypothetical protein VK886_12190 [Vicinamibacterales bacterium]|nr:hypothetical protein [Vicinamibacterales bacterium]
MALSLLVACDNWEPPLTPKANQTARGAVSWVDPEGGRFDVSDGYSSRVAIITGATQFTGDLRSAEAVWWAYRNGSYIPVTVTGVISGSDGWPGPNMLIVQVSSSRTEARLEGAGLSGHRFWYESNRTALVAWHYIMIVMPWTVFDPTGDITTYEEFRAAGSAGEIDSAVGDGWKVAGFTYHMRTIRVMRKAK